MKTGIPFLSVPFSQTQSYSSQYFFSKCVSHLQIESPKNKRMDLYLLLRLEGVRPCITHISTAPAGKCVPLTAWSIFIPDHLDYCWQVGSRPKLSMQSTCVIAYVCVGNGEVLAHHNYWFSCRCQPVKNVDLDCEPQSPEADRGFLFVYATTITAHTALIPLQSFATQINKNMSIWILVCFGNAQRERVRDASVVCFAVCS